MATATKRARMPAARRMPGVIVALAEMLRNLAAALFDRYRPERHYMRGPGPKWRAKQAAIRSGSKARPASGFTVPALIALRKR